MRVKTSELTRRALDWAVHYAMCCDVMVLGRDKFVANLIHDTRSPSTDWAHGGPFIEREKISLESLPGAGDTGADVWVANMTYPDKKFGGVAFSEAQGPTPLIAAMRCYVASKLGEIVEVPRELYKEDV